MGLKQAEFLIVRRSAEAPNSFQKPAGNASCNPAVAGGILLGMLTSLLIPKISKSKAFMPLQCSVPGCLFLLLSALLAQPVVQAQVETGDVWRDATLYRDEWGVPHVYANNPFAMAFVFGYAQAEDHAENMLLAYRLARGTLAAVLGEPWADSDAFSLKMGHVRIAIEAWPTLDPMTVTLCEGFSMGVNAWLADHQHEAPSWADGVRPEDVLALWHAFLMSQAPFDLPDLFRREPALPSANAWASAPERSDVGAAVLVMNPHQQYDGFFQWYEAHLVLGGMNIYGATLRGLPVILQGHNESLGWALAPNMPDFADMYREDGGVSAPVRNPKDPRAQLPDVSGETALLLEYMSQSSTYLVRTGSGMESRVVPSYIGERGPLFEDPARGLHSWLIGGYRELNGFRQILDMAFATELGAFQSALNGMQLPCFHIVYADRHGDIFYIYNTRTGTRINEATLTPGGQGAPEPIRWYEPQTFKYAPVAWHRVIPPANLPYLVNPPSGYVQACGNPPWTATEGAALNPGQWPVWLSADPDTYRARRIRQLLHAGIRSFRDHQSILYDVVASAAFDTVPALLRSVEKRTDLTAQMHPDFHEGITLLRQWNCIAETGSPGMTFYHLWWTFTKTRALAHYPSEQAVYQAIVSNDPAAEELMIRAVEDAARTLRNEYGTLQKNWGELHRIRRGKREEPLPGALSGEPLFVASDTHFEPGRWISRYGYGFAMAVEFGEELRAVSLLPFGTSENPASPHYDDQLDMLLQRRFKKTHFHHDDILRNADQAIGKSITLLPLGVPGAMTLHSSTIMAARLNSAVEVPESLPPGLAPFSLYMQAERKPEGVPVALEITQMIPGALCDAEGFAQLALFRYEPGLGWQAMDWQTADPSRRLLYGRDSALAQWYVVLGPDGLVKSDDKAAAPAPLMPEKYPVALDTLLDGHQTQPAIGGDGALFVPAPALPPVMSAEPPQETAGAENTAETVPEAAPETMPGRTFKLEKLEGRDADSGGPKALRGIPGFHFGPRSGKGKAADKEAETASDVGAAEGTKDRVPVEKGDVRQEEKTAQPSGQGTAIEAPAPVPKKEEESAARPERKRPPLPDVIPQDPNFLFGPAAGEKKSGSGQPSPKGTFKLERLD